MGQERSKYVDEPMSADEAKSVYQDSPINSAPMLRSRTGQLYQPPAEGGGPEFLRGIGNALMSPFTLAHQAMSDPMGAAGDLLLSPLRIAGGLVTNPAETLGGLTTAAAVPAVLRGGAAMRTAATEPAAAYVQSFLRRFGMDPATIDLATTQKLMQAARSRTRQIKIRGDIEAMTTPADPLGASERFLPNRSGYRNAATDLTPTSGELPQHLSVQIDRYLPNRSGIDAAPDSQSPTVVRDGQVVQAPPTETSVPARAKTPGTKTDRFAEGQQGSQDLEQLVDAIHGPDAPTVPNGGTPSTAPPVDQSSAPTRAASRARQQNQAKPSSARRSRATAPSLQDLSPAEEAQALKWFNEGRDLDWVLGQIKNSRQLQQSVRGIATPDEAAAESERMAREAARRSARGRPSGGEDD